MSSDLKDSMLKKITAGKQLNACTNGGDCTPYLQHRMRKSHRAQGQEQETVITLAEGFFNAPRLIQAQIERVISKSSRAGVKEQVL